jgi:hypothetical protein
MLRRVEPELLDRLPADDPRAVRARRDLKRANALMLHDVILARTLRKYAPDVASRMLVDLGSGDGTFMLRVARRLGPDWRNVHAILVDQRGVVSPETHAGFTALQWTAEPIAINVMEFFAQPRERVDVITANLFLHHLIDDDLRQLFAGAAAMTDVFIACELRRTRLVREIGRMQWMIGAGPVICEDAVVSARAAFLGNELSALWPNNKEWELFEYARWPMTHMFVARRVRP